MDILNSNQLYSAKELNLCHIKPLPDWVGKFVQNSNKDIVIRILWHINICRVFNAKSLFYTNNQFYIEQFSLAWMHSLIVRSMYISSYSG